MSAQISTTCPKCKKPLNQNSKFCANCGNDVSGVWNQSGNNPQLGGTIAIENDPNVDLLGQLLSDTTLGDYEIFGELGRGGMAAVYLGHDMALDRKVAIKTMLPELVTKEGMVARFKREAQTAAALSHPHIIQIFTVKETKELCFFVMKFIEGRSLESVINDKGRIPLEMAHTILGQVGSALDYAHRKKVVHRDIKPANIMIDEDGWAIVTDFGIAKVQEAQNLTATGTAIGTPHYMSPEQFHNKAVTGASDQYSLGVVAYEMLAGKKPFDGGTYAEIITQHLFEAPPDLTTILPDIPQHVSDVVKKMMAKDPADRFPDLDTAIHAFGAPPDKKQGDVVRTQMISLAKSGPQKKLRLSVPMSPIPATKKRPAPAATAIEPQQQVGRKKAPAAAPAEPKGGAGKWIGIAAVLVALAGGGYYYMNSTKARSASTPLSNPVASAPAPDSTAPAATQSGTAQPVAQTDAQTNPPAAAPANAGPSAAEVELKRFKDSLARVETRRLRDSVENARKLAAARSKAAAAETKSAPASAAASPQQQAAAPVQQAPAPVEYTGRVRIGSRTPGAALYINNKLDAPLSSPRFVTITAGQPVRITVKADGCAAPFDTLVTLAANEDRTIGYRNCQ
jgi:serine/threonine protein kinase